jgi:hypothetical protein
MKPFCGQSTVSISQLVKWHIVSINSKLAAYVSIRCIIFGNKRAGRMIQNGYGLKKSPHV